MAQATTRLVRFTARPPARLEADGTVIEAGAEGLLPAALAEQLAANPYANVELVAAPALPAEEPEQGDL